MMVIEFQVSIVSVVYSQSELLQKEVFLVELVDSISMSKESMSHLKAVYFLRPTSENVQHLRRQLANPRFGEYHLCKFFSVGEIIEALMFFAFSYVMLIFFLVVFSNMLKDTQIHILADSDEQEVVNQVQVPVLF